MGVLTVPEGLSKIEQRMETFLPLRFIRRLWDLHQAEEVHANRIVVTCDVLKRHESEPLPTVTGELTAVVLELQQELVVLLRLDQDLHGVEVLRGRPHH